MLLIYYRGELGLSEYNFFNERKYYEVPATTMSWLEVAKLVNRAERLLRIIRAVAFGPAATPPHLIAVPPLAHTLYNALKV